MKRFLFSILLFSAPILLLWILAEIKLSEFKNSYSFKEEIVEEKSAGCETLILGSSLAYKGIIADSIPNAINLANVSQDLFYDSALIVHNFKKFSRLKNVVITVSYFSFTDDLQSQGETWRSRFYKRFNHIEPRTSDLSVKDISLFFLYTPLEAFKMILRNDRNEMVKQISPCGTYITEGTLPGKLSDWSGKSRVMVHDQFKNNNDLLSRNLRTLKNLITFLESRHIRVILINPPAHISYRKFADPEVIKRNKEIITNLCSEYPISYFDHFDDSSFHDEDFNDSNHLNLTGAQKFTSMLRSLL
jgi:hypothetical protein